MPSRFRRLTNGRPHPRWQRDRRDEREPDPVHLPHLAVPPQHPDGTPKSSFLRWTIRDHPRALLEALQPGRAAYPRRFVPFLAARLGQRANALLQVAWTRRSISKTSKRTRSTAAGPSRKRTRPFEPFGPSSRASTRRNGASSSSSLRLALDHRCWGSRNSTRGSRFERRARMRQGCRRGEFGELVLVLLLMRGVVQHA